MDHLTRFQHNGAVYYYRSELVGRDHGPETCVHFFNQHKEHINTIVEPMSAERIVEQFKARHPAPTCSPGRK